jgi:hypothetical protein|tara:strand:- start:189 stop:425 length:237 start_codon:yes stop_codon:yes gene_type:complete
MEGLIWSVIMIQGIIFGSFSAFVAYEKSRHFGLWFLNGFLFSLVALIAICGLPRIKPLSQDTVNNSNDTSEKLDISFK